MTAGRWRAVVVAVQTLWQAQGILPTDPLVVGVSGGVDSLALAHLLRQLHDPAALILVYLDHGWRPEAADEAQFVQTLAQEWGVRAVVGRVDTRRLALTRRQSLEAAAREARYAFLAEVARAAGGRFIAVGHQADDQAETILLHLLRGAGLSGLSGMAPAGPTPGHPDMVLLRPLLGQTRATLEAYCRDHGLTPRRDPSNEDRRYRRNWLRHVLLPDLAPYSPHIHDRLTQLGALAAADDALLEQLLDEAWLTLVIADGPGWVRLDRGKWQALPLSLRRRALRRAAQLARPAGYELTFSGLEQARQVAEQGRIGARVDWPAGLCLLVVAGGLQVGAAPPLPAEPPPPQLLSPDPILLPAPGQVQLAQGWVMEATLHPAPPLAEIRANQERWRAYVALPDGPLWLRGRRPGERIQPLGLGGHSTPIKEVMIDRKLPAAWRALWPVVATNEHPVWLTGWLVDERCRVTPTTTWVVVLRCYRPADGARPVDGAGNG